MSEEQKLILNMLSEGKINASEAEKLLIGIEVEKPNAILTKSNNKKFLKILVIEENNTKVNINIPIALAEVGLQLIPKDKLKINEKEININQILNLIKEGNEGELVNIQTKDHGKDISVKIFID